MGRLFHSSCHCHRQADRAYQINRASRCFHDVLNGAEPMRHAVRHANLHQAHGVSHDVDEPDVLAFLGGLRRMYASTLFSVSTRAVPLRIRSTARGFAQANKPSLPSGMFAFRNHASIAFIWAPALLTVMHTRRVYCHAKCLPHGLTSVNSAFRMPSDRRRKPTTETANLDPIKIINDNGTTTPWSVCDHALEGNPYWTLGYTVHGNGKRVADVADHYRPETAIVVARLIAAAPDLLEVAIRCEQMVSTDQGPPDWDWIRSVIRKATQPST